MNVFLALLQFCLDFARVGLFSLVIGFGLTVGIRLGLPANEKKDSQKDRAD